MNVSRVVHSALKYAAIPAFNDNYIWAISNGRDAVVIDPGDATPVQIYLHRQRLQLSAILLTHHHADHTGGVAALARKRDIPVYGPAFEAIRAVTHPMQEKDCVQLTTPELTFTVLEVPGHTRGHIAFFLQGSPSEPPRLFCGDTLFACGCGRLFEGTPPQMLASLDKLAALPDTTYIYCAHEYTLANIRFARACEPENTALMDWQRQAQKLRTADMPTLPTTIGHEKQVNPFLRLEEAAILQRVAARADRLAVFTALRAWKDDFVNP